MKVPTSKKASFRSIRDAVDIMTGRKKMREMRRHIVFSVGLGIA